MGVFADWIADLMFSTVEASVDGSPGPLDMKSPS
jgi:hypothetical protein